jgi:hypothetical protein
VDADRKKASMGDKMTDSLFDYVQYNPETGVFRWKQSRGPVRKGQIAGSINHGYRRIKIKDKTYSAHRLAWYMVHGEWPENEIDHIDGNKDNNSIKNLRPATRSQNMMNSSNKPRTDNTSGARGVYYHKQREKWSAMITVKRKQIYLGIFDDKEEAIEAYRTAKEIYHDRK